MKKSVNRGRNNAFVIICIFVFLGIHLSTYYLPRLLPRPVVNYDLTIACIDDKIPLEPLFLIPYYISFIWWFVGFLYVKKERFYEAFFTGVVGYIIIFTCYMVFPVSMKEVEVVGEGPLYTMVRILHKFDPRDNILPSMHVFCSLNTLFSIAFDKSKNIVVRIIYWVLTISVCLSTLFLKQHYFVDVVAGISVAIFALSISKLFNMKRILINIEEKYNLKHQKEE